MGGAFTTLGGQTRNGIGRLNADGSLDSSFNPGAAWVSYPCVYSLAVQADGKILVGGWFSTLGGQPRNGIGRLNADGSLDSSFNPGAGASAPWVFCLAAQADGKILVGGGFTNLVGQTRIGIGRLNADGSLDGSFNPGVGADPNSGGPGAYSLTVQADGKILVGGDFITLGGQSRTNIGRLNADGSLDSSFDPGANGRVVSLAVQADGRILVGGGFTTLGGQTCTNIGRLNADGSLDSSFNPGTDGAVNSLAVQADGKMLVGGEFTTLGGQTRGYIARLNNTGPATQSLSYDGSTITWLRGGSSPEVWRVTFDFSTNASTWSGLGAGSRVPGTGWQLTSVSPPPGGTIRARGYATGGEYNGSGWFVEAYWGSLAVVIEPSSLANDAGTTAALAAVGGGTEPLGYQWLKNGVPLVNGGNVTGALTPTLTLSNLLKADEAQYAVVVTNASGSVTSLVATLTVNDPAVTAQPASQQTEQGQSATLSLKAAGTEPLSYQWLKDGTVLPWATASALTLTNLQGADAGNYSVVVSNVYASVTSAVAVLTVNSAILDSSFNPGVDGEVDSLAVQTDGRILVGGRFTTLGGQTQNYIGRLNADGSLDSSFNPGAGADPNSGVPGVYSLAVQVNGKILVGGWFTTLGGQTCNHIGRLNADGSLDSSFNSGADSYVVSLAVQADGKILVGGGLTTLGGQSCNGIGRLNADGSLDSSFNAGADLSVDSIVVQADGKILVGGVFTTLGGQGRNAIGRLNADGSLDSSFNAVVKSEWNPNVSSLAVQADGKILVAGFFSWLDGQPRNYMGRLNADGSLDSSFNPGIGAPLPTSLPWPCRLTGGSWWGVVSPRWAGRRAQTLAGSMPMAAWTAASTREWGARIPTSVPLRRRPTGRFWWAAASPRWAGRRA